jgi:hypothetical protein
MSSGPKKKEPTCTCLSNAKASPSHKTWIEVSSSAPHLLRKGLQLSPIKCRCLLRVLCPGEASNNPRLSPVKEHISPMVKRQRREDNHSPFFLYPMSRLMAALYLPRHHAFVTCIERNIPSCKCFYHRRVA